MDSCLLHLESVQQSDTLIAIANSVCGSDSTGEIIAYVFPGPSPDLGKDTTLSQGESILLDAGDYESFLWSTGDTERTFRSFGRDTLSVLVTDTNSCSGSDTIIISLSTVSLKEPATLSELKLYPNPVSDVLHLYAGPEISLPYQIMIYNQQGSLIRSIYVEEEGPQTIEVGGGLDPGYYILKVQSAANNGVGRFVVK